VIGRRRQALLIQLYGPLQMGSGPENVTTTAVGLRIVDAYAAVLCWTRPAR
jgi:hypothetical protein